MPWKTLCGFEPTKQKVKLLVPNGAWRADTVITDTEGTEYFVLLEVDESMRTYEAIFADLEGNPLVCVKRHCSKAFWEDGYYFCTYRPNYRGQRPFMDRDIDGKKVYPHSYLEVNPMKGRFHYRFLDEDRQLTRARMSAHNPWMGFMMGCCTCCMRCGRFTAKFKKRDKSTHIFIDQWKNQVKVAPNNDLLAALCIAYVFDKCQCQPMIILLDDEENYGDEDDKEDLSSNSSEGQIELEDMSKYEDEPRQQMPAGYQMPSVEKPTMDDASTIMSQQQQPATARPPQPPPPPMMALPYAYQQQPEAARGQRGPPPPSSNRSIQSAQSLGIPSRASQAPSVQTVRSDRSSVQSSVQQQPQARQRPGGPPPPPGQNPQRSGGPPPGQYPRPPQRPPPPPPASRE